MTLVDDEADKPIDVGIVIGQKASVTNDRATSDGDPSQW